MEGTKWVERWKFWIAPKPSRPGVWRLRGGGYLVRGRATDFRTGKKREILRTVKDTDAAGAYKQLQEALDEVRNGVVRPASRRMRFSEFAASLFERKVGLIRFRRRQMKGGYDGSDDGSEAASTA